MVIPPKLNDESIPYILYSTVSISSNENHLRPQSWLLKRTSFHKIDRTIKLMYAPLAKTGFTSRSVLCGFELWSDSSKLEPV
ncbi:hypothetical protein Hdeb2414_s0011g00364031 [Helianthus debilis subsp. tardiflorus]